MCGRYQLALQGPVLARLLDARLAASDVQPTWNAAPGRVLPVLGLSHTGERVLQQAQWGLVPEWVQRTLRRDTRPLINARAETVLEKPSFRSAMHAGRVLVPVTGFYEWTAPRNGRTPHLIRVRGRAVDVQRGERIDQLAGEDELVEPFLLAGIMEEQAMPDGALQRTFSIITTTPNELCAPIHDRMPAILEGNDAQAWLETLPQATASLLELLRPLPAARMEAWPVSRAVNDARCDDPALGMRDLVL